MTIRHVLRRLWVDRRPVSAVIALLGFAAGVSGAVFGIAHVVLATSLPVPDPDRLVTLSLQFANGSANTVHSYPVWLALRDGNPLTSGFAASTRTPFVLADGSSKQIDGALVSANYFEVLGVGAQVGRLFTPTATPDGEPICVISHGFWQRQFGGRADLPGTTLLLNGRTVTVVGILAARFNGVEQGAAPDVYVPVSLAGPLLKMAEWSQPGVKWLRVLGRLRSGATPADAATSLQALVDSVPGTTGSGGPSRVVLTSSPQGFASLRFAYERPLVVLMGIVTLILVLTSVNVFVLLMALMMGRTRELAVCLALGARRTRLVREVLIAGTIIGAGSGALAVLLSQLGIRGILSLLDGAPAVALQAAAWNPFVVVMSLVASVTLAIALNLAAAAVILRHNMSPALSGRDVRYARGRLSRALISVQVATSLVLVMCALLFVATLYRLERVDIGFRPGQLIVATMNTTATGKGAAPVEEYERLLERVSTLPGVQSASLARVSVLSGQMQARDIEVPGHVARQDAVNHLVNRVSPGYFATMGIPIRKGRDVSPQDRKGTARVVVVNERMAVRYWPGQDPIGKRFIMGREVEIVGVVGDSKYMSLREEAPLIIYPALWQADITEAMLHVRSAGGPALGDALRQTIESFETAVSIYDMKTMKGQISVLLATERLLARLSSVLGFLGVLLSIGGLYSVVAYSVARRTKEIGIRMALGADRSRVVTMFLRRNGAALLLGAAAGVTGAIVVGRLVTHLLFGVQPSDVSILAALLTIFAAMAFAGTAGPVLRATRRNLAAALRQD